MDDQTPAGPAEAEKLCIGLFLSICGQIREYDFPSVEACERERQAQIAFLRGGYAVCSTKSKEQKGARP